MNQIKLIKSLIAEVRRLRTENDSLNESYNSMCGSMEDQSYRMEKRVKQLKEENHRIETQHRQEQQEAEYRDIERKQLMEKLDRAESWGDTWGADRIKRKLKDF